VTDYLREDSQFIEWRYSLPETHWAKYDLSACKLGWDAAKEHFAKDAARYQFLSRHATDGFIGMDGQPSLNCGKDPWEWDAWIDAAINPQRKIP